MSAFTRLLKISHTIGKYRLDQLLPAQRLPFWAKCLLLPLKCYPTPKASRGERIRKALEELGPIFIKFGQLLSTRPDLVEADIVLELRYLQDQVPPFDGEAFTRLVEKALGAPVEDVFAEFDRTPLASASVAQVHAATLTTGESVVVKIIRPGLEPTIERDIALMQVLAKLLEKFSSDGKRLRPQEVVEDYRHTILDELNLQREAANGSNLKRNFAGSPLLYIPEVYWDYCRPGVMVTERIDGIPVTDLDQLHAQNTNMKLLAERGVEIFFTQVFEHNFFHADMHPGNIFVSREHPERPQYMAVDMAIVGSLAREDQYYLARNLLAMFRRDYRQVAELHVRSGWVPAGTRVGDFEAAIRSVCEPVFEKPLAQISFGQVLMNLFATARRFDMEVQPQLVLLQKTLLNIEGLGRQLYPELDLWSTAHPYLERWLKNRFCPSTLFEQFKRYSPELLEQLPEIPHLVGDALKQAQNLGAIAPELHAAAEQLANRKQLAARYKRKTLGGLALLAGAGLCAFPAAAQSLLALPLATWLFAGAGIALLVLR